ncbi:MAG: protein translocase subunit SecD, partial [Hyphomicrobiales bacterium]|nr:protein translocase subunit SecD [Hyphomicrobiales bacterium]
RALGTILDANITTFIAALVLFWLGSGPIRGFAITLSIGIITSVFTAFTLTRLMVAHWVRVRRPSAVPI